MLERLKGGLIVSCQALPGEPLHSSQIMARMAVAAKAGGAVGIRAQSKEDILEIEKAVDLPVIEANIHKLQQATGWQPQIGLEQTIEETLHYWRNRALAGM